MSSTPEPKQKMARAPGAATCRAVAMPRNSARPWVTVPVSVTGDVAPAMVIEYTSMGTPCLARAMWMSRAPPSTWSGDAAVTTVEMRGRARKRSRSPESVSQMRSTASTSPGQSTNVTCLRVSVSIVKYSSSSRCSSGTSDALTCVHMMSSCGSSSMSAVHSRRSCSVLARRSPVRKSSVLATQPLGTKWKGSPSSSRTSSASVRPAISTLRGHWPAAHSTSSRGSLTMPVASSTCAPRSASSGRTAGARRTACRRGRAVRPPRRRSGSSPPRSAMSCALASPAFFRPRHPASRRGAAMIPVRTIDDLS